MRRFTVIGLGMFGFYITKFLHEKGHDVIAIDNNKEVIQKVKECSSQAILADATDKETLGAIGVDDVDVAVVGLGTKMDASILVTLYLKEMGIKEIIVKAITEDHAKILNTIGATDTIFPEKDMALKVASSISSINMLDYLPLSRGYSILELVPPKNFIGRSLKELKLRNTFNVQVIAIREAVPEKLNVVPGADFVIKDSDILIIMGEDKNLEKVVEFKI